MGQILTDFRKAVHKYQSDGLVSVFRAFPRHIKRRSPKNTYLFKSATKVRPHIHKFLYKSPTNPHKAIDINVGKITKSPNNIERHRGLGQVIDGDWDKENTSEITEDYRYIGFKQHFVEDIEWKSTDFHKETKKKFNQDNVHQFEGYKSFREFEGTRLEYIDDLYLSIREDGYQPNFENEHQAPDEDIRSGGLRNIHELEPLVAIGRDGEFYLCEGFHRVIISKLLDIESIPVNVLARHRQWQAIRDEVAQADDPKENDELRQYLDHPDLQDVLTN